MSRFLPVILLASSAALGGCVIHVGEDAYRGHDDVQARESRNRGTISQLKLGTSVEQVHGQLGEPDFSEAWSVQGQEVRVLRYRTHRANADGDTTLDETTPLVFKDGKLMGVGERAVASEARG